MSFWKPEACGQTVLPDKSILIEQKLVKNAKIEKFKWDILSNFQTMWPMGVFNKDDFLYRNAKRLPMSPTFIGSLLQPTLSLILFAPKVALISLALANYPFVYPITMVAEFGCIVSFNKVFYGQFNCKFLFLIFYYIIFF